jgi:hypothetical protein
MVFTLSTPFLYRPSQGWLLFEIQLTGVTGVIGATGQFDVESFGSPGGSVASVNSSTTGATDGHVEFSGNIVQFGYTLVVPEPASWMLMLGSLGALATMRRLGPRKA